jgi:hypothetical protein
MASEIAKAGDKSKEAAYRSSPFDVGIATPTKLDDEGGDEGIKK